LKILSAVVRNDTGRFSGSSVIIDYSTMFGKRRREVFELSCEWFWRDTGKKAPPGINNIARYYLSFARHGEEV